MSRDENHCTLISGIFFEGIAAKSETMATPGSQRPLALTPRADLFRGPDQACDVDGPDIGGPLKILMAVAAPWAEKTEGRVGL